MATAANYRQENKRLLEEYEARVRAWLANSGVPALAEQIPYFRDGVVCPEIWFQPGNTYRPLFILKEVSLGINEVSKLSHFMNLWGNQKHFEFAENPFDDIRIGSFPQWRRIARLAKGLEEIHDGADICDYYKYNFDFLDGGEAYAGTIDGYKKHNHHRTANPIYNDIVNKMAVLEIKKIGAGQVVTSELSIATRHYSEHIEPFQDLLCRQIELIDPTVIICLGREWGSCISNLLTPVKDKTQARLWIDGYHHTRSSNKDFYEKPLNFYRKHLKGEHYEYT